MKIINTGVQYEIYADDLKSYDKLPAGYYSVKFQQMRGFYLEKHNELIVLENKIYGQHMDKVEKIVKSFQQFQRNLGVILSGDKGIGKSMCCRLLGIRMVEIQVPVIIVDSFIPGIGAFLEKIDQEVMVLFDEFDKTYGKTANASDGEDPQTYLLSIFDGVSAGKKLFVITCNDINKLNGFLINRPGRFHYHLRFSYPTAENIKMYLEDKLEEQYYDQIENVIKFSKKVSLNYDCLRAICFELNNGIEFSNAILDLNILNVSDERYRVMIYFEDGTIYQKKNERIDMFDDEKKTIYLQNSKGEYAADFIFNPADAYVNNMTGEMMIGVPDVELTYDDYDCSDEENKKREKELKGKIVKYVTLSREGTRQLHYVV